MPHSSSGFGEIRVNRMYLVEQETAKEDREGKFSISGQESSPPTTVALVAFLHEQITSLQKGVVLPVTFRDKAEVDGYYTVENANSELTDHQSEVSKSDWTIDLHKCGTHTEVDLQSRLTGAVRDNDFSQSGERWHAPPIGHYSYFTGATDVSSWVDRAGADGTIRVYRNIPSGVHPRWGCTPTNYYGGRVRLTDDLITDTENEVEGCCHKLSTDGWSLSNGLVNVTPTASAGILDVQTYSGGAYRSQFFRLQRNSSDLQAWQSVSIIRNTFEQVIIRLTANIASAPGRVTLDLNLRRGSRFVECYLQSSSSTTLKVAHASTVATTGGTGYIVRTSLDGNNNKSIIGSARTFTADNTNGAISKAATTALDFYLGSVVGSSPQSGDAASDLQSQYIGALPESTYYVKR